MALLSSKTGFTPSQSKLYITSLVTPTSVQDFAAYQAQEIIGFVYIQTSTSTFQTAVRLVVNKSGAGTYEVASLDLAGDTVSGSPLITFAMSGSMLQLTPAASISGTLTTAYIQFQINAPVLGGTFPLSLDATSVVSGVFDEGRIPTGRVEVVLQNVTTPQTVKDVSASEAGEFSGWVYINATVSKRFYLKAQVSRNGAGTDYNVSFQTSGETPPSGFNISVTSAGVVQLTLASASIAGFVSAKVNYRFQ